MTDKNTNASAAAATATSTTIKATPKRKSKKTDSTRAKPKPAVTPKRNASTPKAPVIDVDQTSIPVQDKDVSPINPVGFEPGKYEYVRPTADKVEVPGQKYWVLSYVTPDGEHARAKNVMVKCSGCFPDERSANERALWVRNSDPRINVFVVDMYVLVSVPVPTAVFEGIRKNYMDEKLDKIMHQNYISVQKDRMEMERRKEADKRKALQNMRNAKGDQGYTPNQDHTEFVQNSIIGSTVPNMKDQQMPSAEYGGEEIVQALEFAMKMAKVEGDGSTTGAVAEQFAANMMKQLVEAKASKMYDQKAARDTVQREGYNELCAMQSPAVSDTLAPDTKRDRKPAEADESTVEEDTI